MGQQNVRFNLANSVLISRVLPVTAGTFLLFSTSPAQAHGQNGGNRGLMPHRANGQHGYQAFLEARTARNTNNLPGQLSNLQAPQPQVSNRSFYFNDAGRQRNIHNGVSFDLSSTNANITVGSNLVGTSQVTIEVGGATKQISSGTQVTAAEYAALNQVLATGNQQLKLNDNGAAAGGSLNVNLVTDDGRSIRTSELVIPEGVLVSGDFARRADGLRVTHDLVNYGSLLAVSSSNRRDTAIISARDINNFQGASISSDPSDANLNLALRADRDLNNSGDITSAGALELSAGRSLNNSGTASAHRDLAINAGDIRNSGLISSDKGDINITAPTNSHLVIDNSGGEFRALGANINVATTPGDFIKTDTTLTGGDWHSDELNIVSGDGSVSANVGDLSGMVNVAGGSAVFNATGDLLLGKVNTTGDPLFSSAGNLTIAANITTGGQPLSIIAGGNVNFNAAVTTVSTAGATGGTILVVAGAAFTTPSDLEITGGTAAGGNINFNKVTTITSAGTTTNGGNIQMIAFPGAGTGSITIPAGTTVNAGGTGAGKAGNVTIVGGATTGTSINIDSVITNTGSGGGGAVTIASATPTVAVSPVVIETTAGATQGAILSGSFGIGAAAKGNVSVGNIQTSGAAISITGGGDVSTFAIDSSGQFSGKSGGNITVTSGATGLISIFGSITSDSDSSGAKAGNISVTGGSGASFNILGDISASSPGGLGGAVVITAKSTASMVVRGIDTTGDTGGTISVSNTGNSGISLSGFYGTRSFFGAGGSILIDAFGAGSGNLQFSKDSTFDSFGKTVNGDIDIVASNITTGGKSLTLTSNIGPTNGNITLDVNGAGGITTGGGSLTMQANNGVLLNVSSNIVNTSGAAGTNGGAVNLSSVLAGVQVGPAGVGNITTQGVGANDNGGTVTISAPSVVLGAINTKAGSAATAVGGAVSLTATGTAAMKVGAINTSAAAGTAGKISITSKSNVDVTVGALNSKGGTTSGDISVLVTGTGDYKQTGAVTGANVTLDTTAGGDLILGTSAFDDVVGTTTVKLLSGGQLVPFAGIAIGATDLVVQFKTGPVALTTAVQTLSTSAAGQNLTIFETNAITLNSQTVGNLQVFTTNGNIATNANITGFAFLNLQAGGAASTITLNNNLTGALNGVIALTTNGGNITQTAGSLTASGSGGVQVTLNGATPGKAILTSATNNVPLLTTSGGGLTTLNNGGNALQVSAVGATSSLDLTTTNAATGIQFTQNVTTSGTITLNTPRFFTDKTLSAASFLIQNLNGDLTIAGTGAKLTGTVPAAGAAGTPSNPAAIIFNTALTGKLNLIGTMTFTGDVAMNNFVGTTTAQAGALFTGNNNITLSTNSYVQQGAPQQIVASNFILNITPFGTVINTVGGVVFNKNTTIKGSDFAIIANGDIDLNATIDLSSASGNGGTMTLIAGALFSPPTVIQTETASPFTFSSFTTGDINAGSAIINTSATGATGNGGNVLAIASNGIATLGTINSSSANGKGGSVTIIGEKGVSVGDITTKGLVAGGGVQLVAAKPNVGGTPVVTNGTISGGTFSAGAITAGNVSAGKIDAGDGAVAFQTNGAASTISVTGDVLSSSIALQAGTGVINLTPTLFAMQPSIAGNGGLVLLVAADLVTAGPTTFDVSGSGAGNGGTFIFTQNGNSAVVVGTDIFVDASAGTGSGGVVLVTTAGDLTYNAGGINAAGVNGNGAGISLQAAGALTLNDTAFLTQTKAAGASADGGSITLKGASIVDKSTSASPLVLDASATGTGFGGNVDFETTDGTPTFIGSPAKPPKGTAHFITVNVQGGDISGGGGDAVISVGGALTVDTAKLQTGPRGATGNGSDIQLSAGTGLVINGNLDASAKGAFVDGDVILNSNSKTAFTLGATKTPKNGIFGNVTADELQVTNAGGGIKVNTTAGMAVNIATLTAGVKGTIATGKSAVITAASGLTLNSDTGAIGKKDMLVSTAALQINTLGTVNVKNVIAGPSVLTSSTAGKKFVLTAVDDLTLTFITTTGGSILVTGGNTGTLSVANGGDIHAVDGSVTLVNPDTVNGDIFIGDNAKVQTSGAKGGNTVIAIGSAPKKGTDTTVPAGFNTPVVTGKGQAFFDGPIGSIIGTGPTNADVNALDKLVIFFNGSDTPLTHLIQVGSAATITADPPVKVVPTNSAVIEHSTINMPAMSVSIVPVENGLQQSNSSQPTTISQEFQNVNLNEMSAIASNRQGLVTLDAEELTKSTNSNPLSLFASATMNHVEQSTSDDFIVNAAFHHDEDLGLGERAGGLLVESVGSSQNEKQMQLTIGNVVFAPKSDTTIVTAHGSIRLLADSVVLIMNSANSLAVYDLDDHHKNSVVVETAGKKIHLSPGHSALVSSHRSERFEEVNPIELLQYRGMNMTKLSNGWSAYTSQFSIPSACFAVKPLRNLIGSKHPSAVKLKAHMLKTTAVIMTINPDRGDFVQYCKPRVSAMR